tara:strand:+ start:749 stop:985 length:237 start_codon:yes stop_codon:yes gene_type:complete
MVKKELELQLEEMTVKYNKLYAEAVKLSDNRVVTEMQLMIQAVRETEVGSKLRDAYNTTIAVKLGVMKIDEPNVEVTK